MKSCSLNGKRRQAGKDTSFDVLTAGGKNIQTKTALRQAVRKTSNLKQQLTAFERVLLSARSARAFKGYFLLYVCRA